MLYAEKDGLKHWMEQKENSGEAGEFPLVLPKGFTSYVQCYQSIEQFMNENIHTHVVAGAAAHGSGLLNDHGIGHITMVQDRASALLQERVRDLRGYEIFILLLAIHFHDVGNIFGREEHEERIVDIFKRLGNIFPLDYPIQRLIVLIATAHGGYHNEDKDTLSYVPEKEYIDSIPIRAALLASLLRFADEIADDKTRVSSILNDLEAIPNENRVFHEYSRCLEPPVIEGDTIILIYNIDEFLVFNKTGKLNEEVFVYDEILSRIQKALCELDYCKRYSQGFIRISALSIKINVIRKSSFLELYSDGFRARITGYPEREKFDLALCCDHQPKAKNGAELSNTLRR